MKNSIKVTAFVAVISLLGLAACNGKSKSDTPKENAPRQEVVKDLKFTSFSYDMIARIDSDTVATPGGAYIRVTGEGILPESLGDDNVRVLRDSLERMIHVRFDEDENPVPVLDPGRTLTDLSTATTEACGSIYSRLGTSFVNPRIVVFDFKYEFYECMAAHGMNGVLTLNYDLAHGKILSLYDIVDSKKLPALHKLIRDAVKTLDIPLLVSLQEIEIPSTFTVTSEGIDFIFQPYEIAPYSEGVVRVTVPLESLIEQNLLTPEGDYIFNGPRTEPA